MPVLPEFRPVQAPGAESQSFVSGYERGASLMERKQRQQMMQEQQEMERAKFTAMLPAIVAKQQADVSTAAASVANAARVEQLRQQAAQSSTDYNDRFINIMSIPDDKDRSDSLGAFMGEVSWLDNPALPEYQGFAKTVREERAKSFTQALTNMKLDEQLEMQRQRLTDSADIRREIEQLRIEGQNSRNAATNETRLQAADKTAAQPAERVRILQEEITNARAEGDEALAGALAARLQKETTFSSGAARGRRELPPAVAAALGVKPTEQAAAPAKSSLAKPAVGTRAKQNGVWYKFDGNSWVQEAK